MADYGTVSYQTETPKRIYKPWKMGPADSSERYGDRLTELQAADLLVHADDLLDDSQRHFAEEVVADADGDLCALVELAQTDHDLDALLAVARNVDDLRSILEDKTTETPDRSLADGGGQ